MYMCYTLKSDYWLAKKCKIGFFTAAILDLEAILVMAAILDLDHRFKLVI